MRCGHWTVEDTAGHGYWLARCVCGGTQEVRLNATQTHVPPCGKCGARTDAAELGPARKRHFSSGAYYLGKFGR